MVEMNSNIMFLNNPECFTTQKMCDKAVQKNPIMIRYVPTLCKCVKMLFR